MVAVQGAALNDPSRPTRNTHHVLCKHINMPTHLYEYVEWFCTMHELTTPFYTSSEAKARWALNAALTIIVTCASHIVQGLQALVTHSIMLASSVIA